jgi:hypothetical protein
MTNAFSAHPDMEFDISGMEAEWLEFRRKYVEKMEIDATGKLVSSAVQPRPRFSPRILNFGSQHHVV